MQDSQKTDPTFLAQSIMTFAMDAANAAQELMKGAPLSERSLRVIAATQNSTPPAPTYLHPTAESIAEDDALAEFAVVCAVRALKDALAGTNLGAIGHRLAAAALLNGLGDVESVERALASVRKQTRVKIPFAQGMRFLSKALYLAAHHGREGIALPQEGIDFVEHVARMIEVDQILPGNLAGEQLGYLFEEELRRQVSVTGHENLRDFSRGLGSTVTVPYAQTGAAA